MEAHNLEALVYADPTFKGPQIIWNTQVNVDPTL